MKIKVNNIIDIIKYNLISIVILMNSLQFILSNDFNIRFNMWIEYGFIIIIFGISKFKIKSRKNLIILLISILGFLISKLLINNETLNYYINQFELYALPIIIIGLLDIDFIKFIKVFFIYNIIMIILYMVMLILNKGQNVEDYMTFGYYAMFSAIYVIIYSYYNKHKFILTLACITIPLIIINGNRGTIIVFLTALILMILTRKDIVKGLIFSILIIFIINNISNIAKSVLDFVTNNFEIRNSYSIRNFYDMLNSNDSEDFLGGRYTIYEEAVTEIEQNLLTGIGIAKFQDKYGYFPHNIFLDIYVTFGIILGTIYLCYLLGIGVKLYKYSKENLYIQILFVFLVANIMKLLLSKTFIYDTTIWLYIIIGNNIIEKMHMEEMKNETTNNIYTNI